MLISLENVSKLFGSDLIFHQATAKIEDHDRIGFVGGNGAGKTTLLNVIAGIYEHDEGEIARKDDLVIGYQRQNCGLTQKNTIMAEMRSVFADVYETEREMKRVAEEMAAHPEDTGLSEKYHELENRYLARDGYHVDVKINTVLTGMGFAANSEEKTIDKLSGGEQTRLAIAKLLLEEPELLILDEPTNHLDFKTLGWLEEYLLGYKGAILTVSHDRYFLDKIAQKIWEMDRGELTVFPGNYSRYLVLKEERDAHLQKVYEAQMEERAKLEDYVARNLVRASTTKMAQSRQKMLERMEPAEKPKAPLKRPTIRLNYEGEPVKDVLDVQNLTLKVGSGEAERTLLSDVSFHIMRGEKVALIGGNGTGKTTLFRRILDQTGKESSGKVTWGRGVHLSYYEQGSEQLDPNLTVLDTMWKYYPRMYETPLRSMLGALGLTGEDAFKKVSQLSGGERARLKLSVICLAGSNVLLLDEPTNHLDLATKEVLEQALKEYTGTLILITHDRYLLDRLPNRIFALENGSLHQYKGRYTDYLRESALQSQNAVKQEPAEKEETGSQKVYRHGKEARREEARKRKDYADTEKRIGELEAELQEIAAQLALPETGGDYQKLQELCARQEEAQQELSEAEERWLMLSEELENRE